MQRIDIHTHLLPAEIPNFKEQFGYGGFIKLNHHGTCKAAMVRDDGKSFRDVESNCYEPATRIAECDEAGVSVQVLSTVPVMFSYWAKPKDGAVVAGFLNDHLAEVVAGNPDRFIGLGTLPMQDPELAAEELERCVTKLGFAGVQIGSHVNDWNLNEPNLFPIYAAAERLSAAIFVHPWEMMGEDKMSKYWLPWLVGMPAETSRAICSLLFGGVFEKFPKLRFAFAHGGGSFPITVGRIEHGFKVRPDLCAIDNKFNPRDYLGKFWVDSLVHDAKALEFVAELLGEDKVVLGTDYPFPLGEHQPGSLIESMSWSPERKMKMLWSNAFDWLGVSSQKYEKSAAHAVRDTDK